MANVKVYNMEGKEVGTLELNDAVFGVEVNEHLMHLAVVGQLANKRQGTPVKKKALTAATNAVSFMIVRKAFTRLGKIQMR